MIEFQRDELVEIAAEMVSIPSINPDLVPGAEGEAELAQAIAKRLSKTPGIEVILQDAGDGEKRSNVIATAGSGSGRTLLLNGHIDTVGVVGMEAPFDPIVADGKLYGRGSYDMKGSMAGATLLLEHIARAGDFPGRLVVTYVVDEEYASIGTQAVVRELDRWKPDAAICLENSDLDICVAHKGFVWAEVVSQGVAAHGSRYWLGIDAIAKMGKVQVALGDLSDELLERTPHRYLGPPSMHQGLISGGQEISSYAASCYLQVERRTIPGETRQQIEDELQTILSDISDADPDFRAMLEIGVVRQPFEVSEDEEIVQVLKQAATVERGKTPEFIGKAGWADSALLAAAGLPTAYFGPAGFGAHGIEEWVDLDSLESFTRILARTAYDFCGAG